MTTLSDEQLLKSWLESVELEHLHPVMVQHGVTTIPLLGRLDDNDLQEMGVSLGDRKRLHLQSQKDMEAIEQKEQDELKAKGNAASKAINYLAVIAGVGTFLLYWLGHADTDFNGSVGMGLFVGIGGWIYVLPTKIAFKRAHEWRWAIALANIFFGFTGLIWLILFALAIGIINPTAAAALGAAAVASKRRL